MQLDEIVSQFNQAYREWADKSQSGANFRFVYEPTTGHKVLEVLDTAPLDPGKPKDLVDPRILSAEDILSNALKEVVGGEEQGNTGPDPGRRV